MNVAKQEITATGFQTGYRCRMETPDLGAILTPPCPFELRSDQRRWWLRGWARGSALATDHRRECIAAIGRILQEVEKA